MTKETTLTRTCAACGLDKPLSAFLQITGAQGTIFGNICSTCRSSGVAPRTPPKRSEEQEKNGGIRLRIGGKEKIYIEGEQKRKIKDLKDLFQIEAKRREELSQQKSDSKESQEKIAKDHRKLFIEGKKTQGFLAHKIAQNEQATRPQQRADQKSPYVLEQEISVETIKQEDAIRHELQITSSDLAVPYLEPQTWHLRYHGENFLRFKAWLGTSSPIVTALEKLQPYARKHQSTEFMSKQISEKKEEVKERNLVDDFLDKRLGGPSSKKR